MKRKVKLFKHPNTNDHPWILIYGAWMDCKCGYNTWEDAVADFPHAINLTFGLIFK